MATGTMLHWDPDLKRLNNFLFRFMYLFVFFSNLLGNCGVYDVSVKLKLVVVY